LFSYTESKLAALIDLAMEVNNPSSDGLIAAVRSDRWPRCVLQPY